MSEAPSPAGTGAAINAVVAMIRVTDVERSAEFYRLLGFEIGNYVPREAPPMHWAWLYQPQAPNWKTGANLMLVRSDGAADKGSERPVVLYLYAADLIATRAKLIAAGIQAGEICFPEYLPKGEFESRDPDGYRVMVAQSYERSP
jgi:catechol 2,3-dioxygenase-like lactoylglutathione lyase family enzyme